MDIQGRAWGIDVNIKATLACSTALLETTKFYSKLGATFVPSMMNSILLPAPGTKLIRFTGGSYDVPSLPSVEVKRIFEEASPQNWAEMLQYGGTAGMPSLLKELSTFMAGHKIKADPAKEIIVTTGSQEAIDLVSRVFIDKGDTILIGAPTYLQALSSFSQSNPKFVDIPISSDGMNVDILEGKLKKIKAIGKKAKMLYIIPSFQNPDSSLMTMERRKRVLELAEAHDFIIFEDNPYGYISFAEPMPTPLAGMDKSGRVMYTSTFSKMVSPGMRIGWITANPDFIDHMIEAKNNISICNDGLSQYAAAELFKRGDVGRQISKVTKVYHKKRDIMLEAMGTSFPKKAKWEEPKGGLFLWVKFPKKVNTDEIIKDSVAKGVAFVPGSLFFSKPVHNYMRLNYSLPSEEDIVTGIQMLGRLLKKKLQ
ncbi:MAG: PLP-dependent aminotransferase family protein [Candidatus Bathyarchaeota archaeon]|nr:PLP-dependent aminotransferase family protein [Candidatus Bathyarchaeota archaeon]